MMSWMRSATPDSARTTSSYRIHARADARLRDLQLLVRELVLLVRDAQKASCAAKTFQYASPSRFASWRITSSFVRASVICV